MMLLLLLRVAINVQFSPSVLSATVDSVSDGTATAIEMAMLPSRGSFHSGGAIVRACLIPWAVSYSRLICRGGRMLAAFGAAEGGSKTSKDQTNSFPSHLFGTLFPLAAVFQSYRDSASRRFLSQLQLQPPRPRSSSVRTHDVPAGDPQKSCGALADLAFRLALLCPSEGKLLSIAGVRVGSSTGSQSSHVNSSTCVPCH
jgi:hypothetical protein